jgi:hypothetical protein
MARGTGSKDSTRDAAQAAADLAKSMGRFSLAMGLFTARQAARLVCRPGAEVAASLDEIADAANRQLSGAIKTALAVGTNLQWGLVNAAIDMTGLGPRRQKATGPTTGLSIPLTTGVERRVEGMRTVAKGARKRAVPQAELITRLAGHHAEASAAGAARDRIVAGLWKSEGLAGSVGRHVLPGNRLDDRALARQLLPVAHVGFGSGSAEALAFDAGRLAALFSERCARDYLEFSYEGIGATLRFYERGLFKLASGALDFIGLDAADGPDPAGFFADYLRPFPTSIQRLLAHGYGRIMTFSSLSIDTAIEEATTLPSERIEPAVHGAAFAFAMINSMELPRILRHSAVPYRPAVRAAFQNGLIYALVFLEWYAPGVLAAWQPEPGLETELVDHARQEAALSMERGFPLAFRLATPRR